MRRISMFLALVVLSLAATGIASAQSDPRIGTWKLNVAKSKYDAPAPRAETRTYTASGDSTTMHDDLVNNDGSKQSYGYTDKLDGKDYRYEGQAPAGAETQSGKRDEKGLSFQTKKDGKVLTTVKATFSDDGKVMTLTTKGLNANGQSVNSIRVYDKQ